MSERQRQQFTPEFKLEAVRLVTEGGRSPAQVASRNGSSIPNEACGGRAGYEPLPEWFAPDVDAGPETEAIIRAEVTCFFAGAVAQERIDGAAEAEDSSEGELFKAGRFLRLRLC